MIGETNFTDVNIFNEDWLDRLESHIFDTESNASLNYSTQKLSSEGA
jgi:hypothetical protein